MYDIDKYFSKFPTFFDGPIFKDMFNALSGDLSDFSAKCFPYPINLYSEYDDDNKIVKKTILEIALAGFSKDEIKVQVNDKVLKVSIEKEETNESDNKKYHSRGIAKRNASISYPVTSSADIENTKVTFKDGILKIVVPTKLEVIEKTQPKFLDIQ